MRPWEHHKITAFEDVLTFRETALAHPPVYGAFDTEGTGLHIIDDRPFLFQCGWIDGEGKGRTYIVGLDEDLALATLFIMQWNALCKSMKWVVAHNVKFDMHMLANIDPQLLYVGPNLSDTQFWIRMAHDNVPARSGGINLKLKDYAVQFIDRNAKDHERLIKTEQTAIAAQLNTKLQQALAGTPPPPTEWGYRSWTKGCLNDFFKDVMNEGSDLPHQEQRDAYNAWYAELPPLIQRHVTGMVESEHVPYSMLNRANVEWYAHLDIVYTLELLMLTMPVVELRENLKGIQLENECIVPFFEMERTGFTLDRDYIRNCKETMKAYILQQRNRLQLLAGEPISVGQHAKIKQIINRTAICTATGADELDLLTADLLEAQPTNPAIEFIKLVQELRTLEKWYATYLLRFVKLNADKAYTQISQVGAASGRVTSDFQQFPKDAIQTADGQELFHPRKMVIIASEEYPEIVYLDWSQIELRVQALYTMLLGEPDLNLCRAYMPYRCYSAIDGAQYDYTDPAIRATWDKDIWLQEEDNKPWTPTDVHSATTKIAFQMDESHPDFKHNRSMGKRVNFAKNYGATMNRIRAMFPKLSLALIKAIDESYYKAFPGIRKYHDYCEAIASVQPSVVNLFGVRYWNVSGHNLKNMLIQGSSAYLLKAKIVEIHRYMKANGMKSKFLMNIHDELQFLRHRDDNVQHFYNIKAIMEKWDDASVPIVAELEVTTTTWADKKAPSVSWA